MQSDLHHAHAPTGALGPPFIFAKQTERGFMLDLVTAVIPRQFGKPFIAQDRICLWEKFIYCMKVFHQKFWRQFDAAAATYLLKKSAIFLFIVFYNWNFVSMFLLY